MAEGKSKIVKIGDKLDILSAEEAFVKFIETNL